MNTSKFSGTRSGISRHQRGAALIVGLIMLLLLTLIGVAGMRDTLLQEKMAGNMRDREIALQAAESALRAAEAQLGQLTEPVFTNSNGLYDHNTGAGEVAMERKKSGAPVTEQVFWQQDSLWTAAKSIAYPYALDDVKNPPRYVIEKLLAGLSADKSTYTGGTDPNFVTDITAGVEVPEIISYPDYRVTARGEGPTGDARVILQATFRRQ
jgi:type IV pilus assembly protein PilX